MAKVLQDLQREADQRESLYRKKFEEADSIHAGLVDQMQVNEMEFVSRIRELKQKQEKEKKRAEADKKLVEQKLMAMQQQQGKSQKMFQEKERETQEMIENLHKEFESKRKMEQVL
jgi:hypothetical protein